MQPRAQSQTLGALDAELVGISLLHENDQILKRKPGDTKKGKLLKRPSHLKKKIISASATQKAPAAS